MVVTGCWVSVFMGVLSTAASIRVNIRKDVYEHLEGDQVVLPCRFKTTRPPGVVIVSWSSSGGQGGQTLMATHYHPMGVTDVKSGYVDRLSLDVNVTAGRADLKLSSVSHGDQRRYECRVMIPGDEEGRPADTTRLVVYEPPSTPVCTVQGTPEVGLDVNLTCVSEGGSPPPLYRWKLQDLPDLRSWDALKTARGDERGGVLSFSSISRELSGVYVCNAGNKVGVASCSVTLTVLPHRPSLPFMLGAITGALTGAVASTGIAAGRTVLQEITKLTPGNTTLA